MGKEVTEDRTHHPYTQEKDNQTPAEDLQDVGGNIPLGGNRIEKDHDNSHDLVLVSTAALESRPCKYISFIRLKLGVQMARNPITRQCGFERPLQACNQLGIEG